VRRCFRGALGVLSDAVAWWSEETELAFVANLGDLIDGRNSKLGQSATAMEAARALLQRLPCRVVNCIGNHELYNYDREQIDALLGTAPTPERRTYYSFSPSPGWRVLVLDSFHESVIGWPAGHPQLRRAQATLALNNPNDLKSGDSWFRGLEGDQKRFVPYNGAFGNDQLRWLRRELQSAAAASERVVVLTHAVIAPEACDGTTMTWDYAPALAALRASGVVAAVICGHDHNGGYFLDDAGVHHLTLCSPLNLGREGRAFGAIDVYEDRLELRGPRLKDLLPSRPGLATPCVRSRAAHALPDEVIQLSLR